MTLMIIWGITSALGILATIFWSGWKDIDGGDQAIGAWISISLFWPILLCMCIVAAPFIGLYMLGTKLRTLFDNKKYRPES